MKIKFRYYAFYSEPRYDGSYSMGDEESPYIEVTSEELQALDIYFGCTATIDCERTWQRRLTKTYVRDNLGACSRFIFDEFGNPGSYPDDYDFDSFVERVTENLPASFWDYAQFSEVNPQGFDDSTGLISYEIQK